MDNISPTTCNKPRALYKIQSHGCIIIVSKDTFNIYGYSENHMEFFDKDISKMNLLSELLEEHSKQQLYTLLLSKREKSHGNFSIIINNKDFFCHYYKTDGSILLEFEKKNKDLFTENDNVKFSNYLKLISKTNNILDIKDKILKQICEITNYNRILMYKFNSDWSGEVISEYMNKCNDSYVGKMFPETDIPQYVRGLFCRNTTRFISKTNDDGYNVIFKDENLRKIIDASMSNIINVPISHNKYLTTMDVKSSLSLSLMIDNKLWGIIICHSTIDEIYLSPFIRLQCQKLIDIFCEKMSRENSIKKQNIHSYIYNLYQYTKIFENVGDIELNNCFEYVIKNLFEFLECDYVVSNINNKNISFSNIKLPDYHLISIRYLINSMLASMNNIICSVNVKKDVFLNLAFNEPYFAGLVFIKLDFDNWVAFIKCETKKNINWAGNPNELIIKDNNILPRNSFSIHQTVINDTSTNWNIDIDNLEEIKEMMNNLILKINNQEQNELYLIDNNELSRKQGLLMSNLTHEIRNPLNALVGIFEVIKFDSIPEQESLIEDGINLTRVLNNHVTNLIDFTKNKYNYTSVNLKVTNLSKLLKDIEHIYKYAVSKDILFQTYFDSRIPLNLITDDDKIYKILSNLVANSCKYTTKGYINININLLNNDGNICWVEFIVKDSGKGIPKEKQYLIFREFQQLDKVSTYVSGSSGLGLSLCHQLVSMLNGSITFESEENWGTMFKCILPLIYQNEDKDNKNIKNIEGDNHIRILVVDDYNINQKIMKVKLEKLGYLVTIANNGQEAVDIIKTNNYFNIIFMDLVMPVLNGIDAAKIIKTELNYTGKIIGLSGNENVINNYKQYHLDEFLLKPFDYSKLNNYIEQILSEI
jgi:light-regulated signal transduction histidine kinase (bacteriophytochrome)/CheY-like chemotaxis protein